MRKENTLVSVSWQKRRQDKAAFFPTRAKSGFMKSISPVCSSLVPEVFPLTVQYKMVFLLHNGYYLIGYSKKLPTGSYSHVKYSHASTSLTLTKNVSLQVSRQ